VGFSVITRLITRRSAQHSKKGHRPAITIPRCFCNTIERLHGFLSVSLGGVVASEETIKDGSYVVQRPFVLVTKKDATLSESAQKFFDYITSKAANEIISGAGVVPAI